MLFKDMNPVRDTAVYFYDIRDIKTQSNQKFISID